MQSRSVVRGSTRSWRSLPLMRSVIGTAPAMFGPSAIAAGESLCPAALFARAGAQPAMTTAAAGPPVVKRKSLRVGSDGLDGESSRIRPPFGEQLIEQKATGHRVARQPQFGKNQNPRKSRAARVGMPRRPYDVPPAVESPSLALRAAGAAWHVPPGGTPSRTYRGIVA